MLQAIGIRNSMMYFTFVGLFVLLPGCGNTSGTPQSLSLNSLDYECDSGTVASCNASAQSRTMRLGLILAPSQSCEQMITNLVGGDSSQTFEYSGSSQSLFNGTVAYGRIENFVDNNGDPATEVDDGNYTACGFIDINQNSLMDSGEPFLDSEYDIRLDLERNLTDWSSAP